MSADSGTGGRTGKRKSSSKSNASTSTDSSRTNPERQKSALEQLDPETRLKFLRILSSHRGQRELSAILEALRRLKEQYGLELADLKGTDADRLGSISIPVSIFQSKLSPLEALVKYLKEDLGLSYKEIAPLLDRNSKTLWTVYERGKKKDVGEWITESAVNVPLAALKVKPLTIYEALIFYLMQQHGLTPYKIAKLLDKQPAPLYVVAKRIQEKNPEPVKLPAVALPPSITEDVAFGDFQGFLQTLQTRTKLSEKDALLLLELAQDAEVHVPLPVFTLGLSPLEALVVYLRDVHELGISDIASRLKRDARAIWSTYARAETKRPKDFSDRLDESLDSCEIFVPLSVFARGDLSVLEALVDYLRETHGFSNRRIGELLDLDQRSVWTVVYRTKMKRRKAP